MALMKNTTLSMPTNNEFQEMSANLDAFFLVVMGMCVICRYPCINILTKFILYVDGLKSFKAEFYYLYLGGAKLNMSW